MSCFHATKQEEGKRLDRCLQQWTEFSRKKVKGLLDQGKIFVDGRKVVIASWQIKNRMRIEVREQPTLRHPASLEHFLKIVYEDNDLLVVEKDPGILCEPSALATQPTFVEIINAYFKRKYPALKTHYLGLVHRLDRDTSGLMVYTKTRAANLPLADQFKRHTIVRKYLAVAAGRMEKDDGEITGYLKKSGLLGGGQKVKLSTPAAGQKAVTRWRLIERYNRASLVEVALNTGRTHQIRVQLASIGHPVVGDRIYGRSVENHELPTVNFPRQALHASYLGFRHPVTGKKVEFESDLPRDMRRLVDRLRVRS